MDAIIQNIQEIQARITIACQRCGRQPQDVQLMLVTKTVPASVIAFALQAGYQLIGENKVQEALPKFEALRQYSAAWHLIGTLQTNKIKDALQFASCIQSLDRLKLAEKLHTQLEKENRTLPVYLEVNVSGELSKQGVAPTELLNFAKAVAQFPTLKIVGLMTIGALTPDTNLIRHGFKTLAHLRETLLQAGIAANELSMGMSGDMEIAIEEGATLIRVGTAIFGERN